MPRARQRRPRQRLERSSYGHAERHAPPRLPAAAIRDFCERIGVSKAYSVVDYGLLESCVRDRLNADAPRAMAVLHPLRVIIDNYPEGQTETIEVENNPDRPELGTRHVTFSREIYVEQEDFMAEPGEKIFPPLPRQRGAHQGRVHRALHRLRQGTRTAT